MEYPAFIIIDMVKDNFDENKKLAITKFAKKIIKPINNLISEFRKQGWPIVFSTDAFTKNDFIFRGKMKPHSLKGTKGAEVIDELNKSPDDLWLPKPRFSAFFNTNLNEWLKNRGVTMCAIGGISTNFCVLATAIDCICYDFKTVLLEDCSAAATEEIHNNILKCYRKNPLYPLFKVCTSEDLLRDLRSMAYNI